jgi:exosome complex component CSL4
MEYERVIPGTYLGSTLQYRSGEGTYIKNHDIYAIVVGVRRIQEEMNEKPLIQVIQEHEPSPVPQVGHIVIARVIRVNPRYAALLILVVNHRPCQEPYKGIIR